MAGTTRLCWTAVLVILACVANLTGYLAHPWHSDKHVVLFVFGDSLYDPGNNNYINTIAGFQTNFRPYGESFFSSPTGRFSDGRLISDFIAEYAKLPLIPAYLQPGNHEFAYGANFASGGAGALVETYSGLVVDLKTQLRYFKDLESQWRQKLGDNEATQLLSNAVYLFSCGGNDYFSLTKINNCTYPLYTREQYVEMVISNLTEVIKEIHEMKGRKFGFVSMPPLGRVPSARTQKPWNGCLEELATLTELHNQALSKELKKLERQLKGFVYSKFDLFTSLTKRLENPAKYGFKEADTVCCGSGPLRGLNTCGGKRGIKEYQLCENASEYLFFDSSHPSEAANKQFAELFWQGSPEVTWPYNLKSFFEGRYAITELGYSHFAWSNTNNQASLLIPISRKMGRVRFYYAVQREVISNLYQRGIVRNANGWTH